MDLTIKKKNKLYCLQKCLIKESILNTSHANINILIIQSGIILSLTFSGYEENHVLPR